MPRGRGQTSLAKNQLQLAIALSSSLEESKARELSKLAEELPADAIEDGAVPQRIKQMQKEFLERLQPKPAAAPARRTRKVANAAVLPTLLTRSCDERLRIITEKVALVLIQDDADSGHPAPRAEKAAVLKECDKENLLWQKSNESDSNRDSYYIKSLSAYVSPAVSKNSCWEKKANLLPERLRSPGKFKPQIPDNSTKEEMDHLLVVERMDFNVCPVNHSNIQQFAQTSQNHEYIDREEETSTELQEDWLRMVNNRQSSDLTIITMEKAVIYAHTLVFKVRCPELLDDVQDGEVKWNLVTHGEAIAFLNFVYSGKLETKPGLLQHFNGLALLARKYKLTQLLKMIQVYHPIRPGNSSFENETVMPNLAEPESGGSNRNISPDMFSDDDVSQDLLDFLNDEDPSEVPEHPDTDDKPVAPDACSSQPVTPPLSTPEKSYPFTTPTAGSGTSYTTPDSSGYIAYNKRKENTMTLAQSKSSHRFHFANSEEETGQSLQIPLQATQEQIRCRPYSDSQTHIPIIDLESDWVIDLSSPQSSSKRMLSDGDESDTADSGSAKKVRHEPPGKAALDPGNVQIEISSGESSPRYSPSPAPVGSGTESSSALPNFNNLRDDSFDGNMNDSVLLPGAEQLTPVQRARVIDHTPLRTPLEDVKTSSPVTPMPEYHTLPPAQFRAELARRGLKRNMSRGQGTKMLEFLYLETHPLAEEVCLRGKTRFIPIFEKSQDRSQYYVRDGPSCVTPPMPCQNLESAVDNPEISDEKECSYDNAENSATDLGEENVGLRVQNHFVPILEKSPARVLFSRYAPRSANRPVSCEHLHGTDGDPVNLDDYPACSNDDAEYSEIDEGSGRYSPTPLVRHPVENRHWSNGDTESFDDEAEENWDEYTGGSNGDPGSSNRDPQSWDGDTERSGEDSDGPDNKPNNQQSRRSRTEYALGEETIFLDSEHTLGDFSDLRAGVHKWLASSDKIYNAVVRYKPLWIQSIQAQLKEFLKVNVKMNELMDVLDHEGICFRVSQQVGRSRRKKSPKKKAAQSKKLQLPKK